MVNKVNIGCSKDSDCNIVYEGQFYNHLPHGQGKCTYESKDPHTGDMKGVSVYEGNFENGERTGYGRNINHNGYSYEGYWKNGQYNGHGVFTRLDGLIYDGEMGGDNGTRNGQGKLTYPDGKTYEGGWKNGKMEGHGTFTWPDGKAYVGDYL